MIVDAGKKRIICILFPWDKSIKSDQFCVGYFLLANVITCCMALQINYK